MAGLKLRVSGTPRPGATLLVANHISWLDIAAVHAVAPQARFVSKADVLAWPLLGWLIRNAGTLFIERERKRDALRVLHQVAEALKAGDTVAVFPEGTTGDGANLLPFHANLLQSAIVSGTPMQCVVIRYSDPAHRFSPAAQFLGETTLLQSVWRILSAKGLCVHVDLLLPQGARHADRRALAEYLRAQIHAQLHATAPPAEPAAPAARHTGLQAGSALPNT
jgi:1-acyl-sn-glycerol-3-phosphate acyltransferase